MSPAFGTDSYGTLGSILPSEEDPDLYLVSCILGILQSDLPTAGLEPAVSQVTGKFSA